MMYSHHKSGLFISDPEFKYKLMKMSEKDLPDKRFSYPENRNYAPINRIPIDWSHEKGQRLIEIFLSAPKPYHANLDFFDEEGFESELKYLALSIQAYQDAKYSMSLEEILYFASRGPEGTKLLKNLRKNCFLIKIDGQPFSGDLDLDTISQEICSRPLDDIDEIFYHKYLPLWKEDVNDLFEVSNLPLETSEEYINQFRATLRSLISDIKIPDVSNRKLEIAFETSRSKTLFNNKKGFNFLRKEKFKENDLNKHFAETISPVSRCIVPAQPGGWRDTIIVDIFSLNTIKFIEKRVNLFLDTLPDHVYDEDEGTFRRKIKKFFETRSIFICRDIEKEGLTKPRILLKIMLEELSIIDKELEPYVNFYETFTYKDLGDFKRGHGQGMANSLTTLMQIILIQMVREELISMGFDFEISSLNYNDDNVTKIPEEFLDDFWEVEGRIMKGLGLIRNQSKSFYSSNGYVFCERYISPYFPNLNLRDVSKRREVLLTFLLKYPFEAKEFLSSLNTNTYLEMYIEPIFDFFGYEFFKEEFHYPLSMGGWAPCSYLGFSTELIDLEDLEFDVRVEAMANASNIKDSYVSPPRKFRKFENFKSIFDQNRIFDENRVLPSGDFKTLYNVFSLWREDPIKFSIHQYDVQKKRINLYKAYKDKNLYKDFILKRIQTGKKLILPFEFLSYDQEELWVDNRAISDPYNQEFPLGNFLAKNGFLYDGHFSFPEEYSLGRKIKNYGKRKSEIYTQNIFFEEESDIRLTPLSRESLISWDENVGDTIPYILAHSKFYNGLVRLTIPLKLKEAARKEEVYGKFLPFQDFISLGFSLESRKKYFKLSYIRDNLSLISITEKETESERKHSDSESDLSSLSGYNTDEREEIERLKDLHRPRPMMDIEDIDHVEFVRSLLGEIPTVDYDGSGLMSRLVAPVLFYYNRMDSLEESSQVTFLRETMRNLKNSHPLLFNILERSVNDGYLREIGELAGIESADPLDEGFGLDIFDVG